MVKVLEIIKLLFEFIRCSPHLVIYCLHKNKSYIRSDIEIWLKRSMKKMSIPVGLIYLLGFKKPFRNIFYYRIGDLRYILNVFCPRDRTLLIDPNSRIDKSLFILHGYSTAIAAKSIGKNCLISQNVTIGFYGETCPTILDNVKIFTGAVIIGNITIGNNVTIGANATVFKDVPDNCTVYSSPSRILHRNKK